MQSLTPILIAQLCFALLACFAVAFGAVAAWRSYSFSRTVSAHEDTEEALKFLERQGYVPRAKRTRTSQCFNLLESGAIRTVKGGYIRAYWLELEPTMFAKDERVEGMYYQAGQLLARDKPEDTILQFRIANFNDGGRAIREHRAASAAAHDLHTSARILHEAQLSYAEACAEQGAFKDFKASMWAFVPHKHPSDHNRNGILVSLKEALKEAKTKGIRQSFKRLTQLNEEVVRRIMTDEIEARESVEKIFRQLESSAPVKLKRLSREETWNALYYGHNESATGAPPVPAPYADLRAYLCRDAITSKKDDFHVMHGRTPVAMVSLLIPPDEEGAPTDIMRSIIENAGLSRRFTVIIEYKHIKKAKAKKQLKFRADLLWKANAKSGGVVKMDEDTEAQYVQLKQMSKKLTRSSETLAGMDFRVLIYGSPVKSRAEEKESIKQLEHDCEEITNVISRTFYGADAGRENPAALRALYHRSIVGEMATSKSYRTIREATDTLAPFMPLERSWSGIRNPHSLVMSTSRRLIGLNFFQNPYTSSALGILIAEPGGGKSVAGARLISDVLGTMKGANCAAIDYGESFAPLADFLGGKKWRFVPGDVKPINVWSYAGIEKREMPDETQINFVVEDAMILARWSREGQEAALADAVMRKCVKAVYQDEVPNNRPGWGRHEPMHRHLVRKLRHMPFENQQKQIAESLASILETYVGNEWIDAPTHPDYYDLSVLDVFELDSLEKFPLDVRRTLAFRVAVQICNRIGRLDENGELAPTFLVFDEMKRTSENYPEILKAIRFNAARQGRKKRTFSFLLSQAWDDFKDIADITATAGVKIIGKQAGDGIEAFVKAAKWTERAQSAIYAIHNIKGVQAQFVISFGAGDNQQIEAIQLELSPIELWIYTTEPIEQNARTRVLKRVPQWSMTEAIIYLTLKHPRGLVAAGLTDPDLSDLPAPVIIEASDTAIVRAPLSLEEELTAAERGAREDELIESYRQLESGERTLASDDLSKFEVAAIAAPAPVDINEHELLMLPAHAASVNQSSESEPELIIGEFAGDMETAAADAVLGALENLMDEQRFRSRQRAEQLGIDIAGAIIVEPEEAAK